MSNLSDIDIQRKTEVLLEALPYFQRFKNEIFVVKFGGSFIDTEQARENVAIDLVFLATVGINVVVVHGGGKAISRAMKDANIEPVFRNGLRVTDARTVDIVEAVLNGETNRDVCSNLARKNGKAQGIRGQDVFACRTLDRDDAGQPLDIGFVGDVTGVNPEPVLDAIRRGLIPVITPLAVDASGQVHNVNADTAAAHLAAGLGARRLVYLCDVPGLLRDPADRDSLISTLSVHEVPVLKQQGVIGTGMAPKVDSAVLALNGGVKRVHFIDGLLLHSLLLEIFTDKGIGTEIVHADD